MCPEQSKTHTIVKPFSAIEKNPTSGPFTETREGFQEPLPHVGTIFHKFRFQNDPWGIDASTGERLCTITNIGLTVAKVFNPNNTTESYASLRWDTEYFYSSTFGFPTINLPLLSDDNALLLALKLKNLRTECTDPGEVIEQSTTQNFNAVFFDGIASAVFAIGGAQWRKC